VLITNTLGWILTTYLIALSFFTLDIKDRTCPAQCDPKSGAAAHQKRLHPSIPQAISSTKVFAFGIHPCNIIKPFRFWDYSPSPCRFGWHFRFPMRISLFQTGKMLRFRTQETDFFMHISNEFFDTLLTNRRILLYSKNIFYA
jgi:hypothetical protein